MNGDIGYVIKIIESGKEEGLYIDFGTGKLVKVIKSDINYPTIDLAYCISIHKSQGSEYPIVIIPLGNNSVFNSNTYKKLFT